MNGFTLTYQSSRVESSHVESSFPTLKSKRCQVAPFRVIWAFNVLVSPNGATKKYVFGNNLQGYSISYIVCCKEHFGVHYRTILRGCFMVNYIALFQVGMVFLDTFYICL